MSVKQHIYTLLAARRRYLGISQAELAARAGMRREKVSRIESQAEDVSFDDFCRLVDALGLVVSVSDSRSAPSPNWQPSRSHWDALSNPRWNGAPHDGANDHALWPQRARREMSSEAEAAHAPSSNGHGDAAGHEALKPRKFQEAGFLSGAGAKVKWRKLPR